MSSFRPDIEGLRAVSITLVIAYHAAPAWLPGGYIGVDVFFVISGFLITLSLLDAQRPGQRLLSALFGFWSRRARRLLPNALLMLSTVSAIGLLALSDPAARRLGMDAAWAAGYAINWLFVARSTQYLAWGDTDSSALLHFWSLAVEEQFYLVWPVALLLIVRGREAGAAERRAAGWALGLALLSFALVLLIGEARLTQAFFSSPSRAWELLGGAWLALVSRSGGWPAWTRKRGGYVGWAGLAAIVACCLTMSPESHHPGWPTLAPVLGSMLLIAGLGGQPRAVLARALGSAPMRAVGARSYSLYLWHWPVLVLRHDIWPDSVSMPLLWLAASVLLAEAAYRWVESPARWRWGRGWPAARVLRFALVGSLAVMMIGVALCVLADRGLRSGTVGGASERPNGLPPLMETRNDLPVVYARGCHLGIEATEPPEHCRLGDSASAPVVLAFGDSHAAQWIPALAPAAAARGLTVVSWTKSSCPSADVTVWSTATRGVYRECDLWREAVFARLAVLRPSLVVVANLDDLATVLIDRRSGQTLRGAAAATEFQAGLERSLQRLRDAGWSVVVIRDNPRPRPDVLDCLYAGRAPQTCERPRSKALAGTGADVRAAAATGTPVWDFTDAICGPSSCPVLMRREGRSIYRDDNHLSATFVATLAAAVAERWPPALGRAR